MSIYVGNNNKNNKNNNIIVSSYKTDNTNVVIENVLDIIINSINIKTIITNINNDNEIIFNLKKLNKKFAKAYVYRIMQGLYLFDKYKKEQNNNNISFNIPQLNKIDKEGLFSIINYANFSRNIINEPSNIFTPEKFATYICDIFKNTKYVDVKKYNHNDIKKMGLRLIDAVGGSSNNKPCFVVLDYKPPKWKKTICLAGKGVTIDTGGYSIKNGDHMQQMYMDKEGAAISIGLFKYFADNNYKNRIVCLCPLVENIVSGGSLKPNDIIKAYDGTTVEIVSTDAEGRLILADTLAYACKNYNPDYIFDYATLTSWSTKIHCHTSFTYFTLNDNIAKNIEKYNCIYAEKSIRISPWVEYITYIKSDIADVKNFGYECVNSDGLMASLFLMNFIPQKYVKKWVHFDIRLASYNNKLNIADGFATYLEIIKNI